MKARKKDSNNEWQNIAYVQLENSDILYKQEYLEFDTLSTELKANSQIANEAHWQDVRERAAIAAMQSLIREIYDTSSCYSIAIDELKKIHAIDEGKAEMDYCFTKMMNGEKASPAWSEEDERLFSEIMLRCKKYGHQEQIDWLKSLKQRIGG